MIASCTERASGPEESAAEAPEVEARQNAAAMVAHHLCSGSFVVGRDYRRPPDQIVAEDIAPFADFFWQPDFTYDVDDEAKIWLNRGGAMPRVPEDAYWAAGHMGQNTVILPSRDVVVVRLGPSPGGAGAYMNETIGRLLDAISPVP